MMDEAEADDRSMIRAEHDRQRRYILGLIGLALFLGLVGASGLILILVPLEENPFPIWIPAALLPVSAIGAALAGRAMYGARANAVSDALRAQESYGDRLQRERNHALLFMVGPFLLILGHGSLAAWKLASGQGEWIHWITAPAAILMPLMVGLILAGIGTGDLGRMRRHLNDEMTQAHRKQALSLGYIVTLGGMTGLYLLGLWRADITVTATPLVLAIGVQVAALKLVLLEREADRDG